MVRTLLPLQVMPEFILGPETKVPCAAEQLSPYAPTTEPTSHS